MSNSKASVILRLTKLTHRYCYQLLNGCHNVECQQDLCATGRRNTAPPGRPIRGWTPRSARAIALALVGSDHPEAYLCRHCPDLAYLSDPGNLLVHEEGPRDERSLLQQLYDTTAIKQFASGKPRLNRKDGGPTEKQKRLDEKLKMYDRLRMLVPPYANLDSRTIANEIVQAMLFATGRIPNCSPQKLVDAVLLTSNGLAIPDKPRSPKHMKQLLSFMDNLADESANRLMSKVFQILYERAWWEERADQSKHDHDSQASNECCVLELVVDSLQHHPRSQHVFHIMFAWTQRVFLGNWGSNPLISDTAAIACLELLGVMLSAADSDRSEIVQPHLLRAVPFQLDDIEIAESWLRPPKPGRHVLSFSVLFTKEERATYFRIINHLRMREAHSETEKSIRYRERLQQHSLPDSIHIPSQVEHKEEHYLLLNVSRGQVLQDAYDQLWQRRSGELLRPLRVRLGEVEELEIGQDLGGVQIEFFNLACKAAFAEDAGMFAAMDKETGMHWFRPGSLQPLYMFELFGLLVALAMFNGVTLPISMPCEFYQQLLMPGWNMPMDARRAIEVLRDGWPAEARTLQAILDSTAEGLKDLKLDNVFPLDANGLRMSVHLPDTSNDFNALWVVDSSPAFIEDEVIEWPGWFVMNPVSGRFNVEPITEANKEQYVTDYVDWLTYTSVRPQLEAFAAGVTRIFKPEDLSLFDADGLQAYVEGTASLNINELQAATRYEGYSSNSPYIAEFWSIVSSWSQEKQKQLLRFVTAAERIPIGGASNITFVIQRVGLDCVDDEDREKLPTSSTCFGTLMLPEYGCKEVLDMKLSVAVELGCEGFGTG